MKQKEAIIRLQSKKQAEIKKMVHRVGDHGHLLVNNIGGAMDGF